jgi:DNA-binding GntR family transcriptional regulator
VKKPNQAQKAYLEIRKQLIARVFEPGKRLTEKEWAEKLGFNRFDIREALSRLLGEGLLVTGSKGGFFVRQFTPDEMNEFNYIRIVLESAAAEEAIEKVTSKDIKELIKVVKLMEILATKNFGMGVFEADLDFHQTFIKSAHNKKLEEIYQYANLPLSTSFGFPKKLSKEELLSTASLHRSILDALVKKDLPKLLKLIRVGLNGFDKYGIGA